LNFSAKEVTIFKTSLPDRMN